MKRRGMFNINLNFTNRVAYTFIALVAIIIATVGVIAYGTSNPAVFGHSAGEVEGAGSSPSGAVMFFDLTTCPTGWTEYTTAQGRYVVGLNTGGVLNSTVGTALSDGENRAVGQHRHTFQTSDGGGGSIIPGRNKGPNAETTNTNTEGSVPGTNAPYVQLLACKKD